MLPRAKKSNSTEETRLFTFLTVSSYLSSFHLLCHPFWAATQPAVSVHLIIQYPGSSYEHMALWPAADLLPGAAATCPVAWCFASISLWLEPSGQSSAGSYMHARGSACEPLSVSIHLYVWYTPLLLLQRYGADRPSLKQRWTCREMGIDIRQSHMRTCFSLPLNLRRDGHRDTK